MSTFAHMRRRHPHYPWGSMALIPPDPRRTSPNLVCYGQRSRYAPLDVFCANGCVEKGKARPEDNGCRHVDMFLASIRPWWRSRARVVAGAKSQPQEGQADDDR